MKCILLAEDEDALVVDELCAFAELIDRANFEALRVFVEDIWYQRPQKRVRLAADSQDRRAKTDARYQFPAREISLACLDGFVG